jgi:FlaA1/EpsC-like NDP-sugar epimerase
MAERAIAAATRVNVLGTAAIVSASRDVGARLVLISSDKAAAPQSVMGATKRLAEHVTLASATKSFRPIVVRFGNVLGSSGSVVDVMRDRLALGRSILVTDPDATRYFMTVGEAVALVMKAVGVARGGETFWLDMGEQVRVGDLARRLSEWEVSEDRARPAIEVIGLRPGEKRVEQLTDQGLELVPTTASRVLVARQRPIRSVVCPVAWRSLRRAVAAEDALAVLQGLCAMVPDFEPSSQAWAVARAERLHQRPVARARTA